MAIDLSSSTNLSLLVLVTFYGLFSCSESFRLLIMAKQFTYQESTLPYINSSPENKSDLILGATEAFV